MSSDNGHDPGSEAIASLRAKPRNVLLFRGFGPLVAAIVLFVLMLMLAPSNAPEHIVPTPASTTTTSTTTSTTVTN